MVSRKSFGEQEFLACVQPYLSQYAVARETDAEGQPGCLARLGHLNENAFYVWDAEFMCALRHAVEDLALEEANGSLLAAFPCSKSFDAHRERYEHLAATIERVEVIIPGSMPRRVPHVKFIPSAAGSSPRYCLVSYQGKRGQAMAVCQQANHAVAFEDRQFEGFYSFNPQVLARMQQDLLALVAGRLPILREFHRLRALDLAAKQLRTELVQQKEALDVAFRRLRVDGERYQSNHFTADLEKGLSRLQRWKTRLPEILARAEGRAA